MSLNRRDIELLESVKNSIFPIGSLARRYDISERNIRYGIENINFYLKKFGFNEISIKNGNVEVIMSDGEFKDFVSRLTMDMYSFSQAEREKYILADYLFKENTKISELEKNLNVSRPTIKKDINNLKDYLSEFELYFERDDNKIFISGKEKKLRHLKLLRMFEYAEIKNGKINYFYKKYFGEKKEQEIIAEYLKNYNIEEISCVVDEIEKSLNANFTEEFKSIIILYLTATLERIENGFIIKSKNNSDFLRKLDEYKIIKNILGKIMDNNLEYEILHLTEYFLSGYYIESFSENILILEKFILKLLEDADREFKSGLSKNKDLSENLMKYLLPAIYRIKNNFFMLNKTLDFSQIDTEIYKKVKNIVLKNNNYLKEPLRDEEIFNVSKYIQETLEQKTNAKISLKELLKIVKENAKEVNVNSLAESIKEKFGSCVDDDREEENRYGILSLLGRDKIYISENEITFDEALDMGLNILLKHNCIREKAVYSMKNLVEKFGRYMFIDKRILFCYDKEKENCIKPGMVLIVSKNGIKASENEEADVLFLLTARNKLEHLEVVSEMIKLIEKKDFLDDIKNLKNSREIELKLKEFLKQI